MNTATLLLYGDHSRVASLLEHILTHMGYQVASLDGTQGMQPQPDLVLVNDLTVCHQLRQSRLALPPLAGAGSHQPVCQVRGAGGTPVTERPTRL